MRHVSCKGTGCQVNRPTNSLVEIGLLQRMSDFLGHPSYSLSIVLFTVILAPGAGSLASTRIVLNTRGKFMSWATITAGYLALLPVWLSDALHAFESAEISVRAMIVIAAIAAAGFLMGFGFPAGMRIVSALDSRPAPWFWGLNGAAGVVAGSVAVACSMSFGIHVTIAIGAVCYVLPIPAFLMIGNPALAASNSAHSVAAR